MEKFSSELYREWVGGVRSARFQSLAGRLIVPGFPHVEGQRLPQAGLFFTARGLDPAAAEEKPRTQGGQKNGLPARGRQGGLFEESRV
jgi:hypothetical protein